MRRHRTQVILAAVAAAVLAACVIHRAARAAEPTREEYRKIVLEKTAAGDPPRSKSFTSRENARLSHQELLQKIAGAVPDKPRAKPAKPRKLLIYTRFHGYYHEAIPYVSAALEAMGKKTGAFETVITDDPAIFEPEQLRAFDAVCMNNNSLRTVVLTAEEEELLPDKRNKKAGDGPVVEKMQRRQQSLLEFVKGGKGLIGVHAATMPGKAWPQYGEMIGGIYDGHPWSGPSFCVESPDNAVNEAFQDQKTVEYRDEIYKFTGGYSRDTNRVLLRLNMEGISESRVKAGRPDGDNPVIWIKRYGAGRVYYCGLGHMIDVVLDPVVLKHWLAGVQYALGDLPADDSPSGKASAPPLPASLSPKPGK
jgi:type 1 glutamine amidotransferase